MERMESARTRWPRWPISRAGPANYQSPEAAPQTNSLTLAHELLPLPHPPLTHIRLSTGSVAHLELSTALLSLPSSVAAPDRSKLSLT